MVRSRWSLLYVFRMRRLTPNTCWRMLLLWHAAGVLEDDRHCRTWLHCSPMRLPLDIRYWARSDIRAHSVGDILAWTSSPLKAVTDRKAGCRGTLPETLISMPTEPPALRDSVVLISATLPVSKAITIRCIAEPRLILRPLNAGERSTDCRNTIGINSWAWRKESWRLKTGSTLPMAKRISVCPALFRVVKSSAMVCDSVDAEVNT